MHVDTQHNHTHHMRMLDPPTATTTATANMTYCQRQRQRQRHRHHRQRQRQRHRPTDSDNVYHRITYICTNTYMYVCMYVYKIKTTHASAAIFAQARFVLVLITRARTKRSLERGGCARHAPHAPKPPRSKDPNLFVLQRARDKLSERLWKVQNLRLWSVWVSCTTAMTSMNVMLWPSSQIRPTDMSGRVTAAIWKTD